MPRRINLVPRAERARTSTNVGMLLVVVAALVVVFALGFGYYTFNSTLNEREGRLRDLQAERDRLQRQVAALAAYEQLANERGSAEAVVQGIYAGRTLVADILTDLSLVVPENVWFVSLNMTVPDPALVGPDLPAVVAGDSLLTLQGNTYSFEDVAQLLVRLQLVEALSEVDLSSAGEPVGAVDEDIEVKGFDIGAIVKNTQPADTPLPMPQVPVELGVGEL